MPALSSNIPSHDFISATEKWDRHVRPNSGDDVPSRFEYILCSVLGVALFSLGLFVAGLNAAWMSWSGVLGIALMWLSCSILFGVGFSLSRANLHSVDARSYSEG